MADSKSDEGSAKPQITRGAASLEMRQPSTKAQYLSCLPLVGCSADYLCLPFPSYVAVPNMQLSASDILHAFSLKFLPHMIPSYSGTKHYIFPHTQGHTVLCFTACSDMFRKKTYEWVVPTTTPKLHGRSSNGMRLQPRLPSRADGSVDNDWSLDEPPTSSRPKWII